MKSATWVSSCLVGLAVTWPTAANEHALFTPAPLKWAELNLEHPQYLSGTLYAEEPTDPKVLFKFRRVAHRSGATLTVQNEFSYPDGKLAVRERVVYEGDTLVSYALEELQLGAVGSASLRRSPENPSKGSIEFTYAREAGGRAKTRTEGLAENTLIADMVGPFLTSHWKALGRGEKVKCHFIVVPRQQTVGFTFVKDSESTWQGLETMVIRMEASSPFVAALVDPMFFTIEKAPPHRVLQYAGRTTPKIQAGGKWKDLDAVMVFDWDSAR
jgi:hypothetical protein